MLKTGDELKIEFNETEFLKRQLACKILFIEKDRFQLDYSGISPYYYQFLYEGQEIKLYSYSSMGIDIMDSIIITSPIEGKFEVEFPPAITHIQRRLLLPRVRCVPLRLTPTEGPCRRRHERWRAEVPSEPCLPRREAATTLSAGIRRRAEVPRSPHRQR